VTPNSKPARRPIGEIWKVGLIGAGVAAIINIVLYLLGRALGSFPATALTPMGRPVDAVGAAVLSVSGVLAGAVVTTFPWEMGLEGRITEPSRIRCDTHSAKRS
jgi:hypothetical protein